LRASRRMGRTKNDDTGLRSRGAWRPSFSIDPPSSRTEGAGNAGCGLHPWSACNKKARGRTTGSAGAAGIPCAMVLTACFVLSPVRPGLVVTVALRHLARRSTCIGAPGPHDFAVRVMLFVSQHARPSHPASNVRDDRDTPLLWRRDARIIVLICPTWQRPSGCGTLAGRANQFSCQVFIAQVRHSTHTRCRPCDTNAGTA
jgi:hypothetical protein